MLENNLKIRLIVENKTQNNKFSFIFNAEQKKESESYLFFQLNSFFSCDNFAFFSMNNFISSLELYANLLSDAELFVLLIKQVTIYFNK